MPRCLLLGLFTAFLFFNQVYAQMTWKSSEPLTTARHHFRALRINNDSALVMGGWINSNGVLTGTPTANCEIIDVAAKKTYPATPMNIKRAEFYAVRTLDSNVIVISGVTDNSGALTPTCELYNRKTGSWTIIGTLQAARRQHTAVMINADEILVVGGRHQQLNSMSTAEIFNIKTGTSRLVADYPHVVNEATAFLSSLGHPLVWGGREGGTNSNRSRNIYRYNTSSNTWVRTSALFRTSAASKAAKLWDGRIIMTGGTEAESPLVLSPDVLVEQADTVSLLGALPVARHWQSVVQYNADSVLIINGFNSGNIGLKTTDWVNIRTGLISAGSLTQVSHSFYEAVSMTTRNASGEVIKSRVVAISGFNLQANSNTPLVEILESQSSEPVTPTSCTQISGIINSYAKVKSVGANSVEVDSSTGFAAGDEVILIQMQGALIDSTNTLSYGTITDKGGAGNYEFAIIGSVSNTSITFTKPIVSENYRVQGNVQLVKVPHYDQAIVSGELMAAPWNGSTGGILALSANCLSLAANIDASGKGFRGGNYHSHSWEPNTNSGLFESADSLYGSKGEGIAGFGMGSHIYGKGNAANGGGGGNSHNGGGGGGANAGAGGKGGYGHASLTNNELAGGLGGASLDSNIRSIFMGGGGGSGQVNNGFGSAGAPGGGIIYIRTKNLINRGSYRIDASGLTAADDRESVNPDGTGGGGAGGTIILDVQNFTGNTGILANGGKGGSRLASATGHGTGGGGGGGLVLMVGTGTHNMSLVSTDGGRAGTALEGGTYGATVGTNGKRIVSGEKPAGSFRPFSDRNTCDLCNPLILSPANYCNPVTVTISDATAPISEVKLVSAETENVILAPVTTLPAQDLSISLSLADPDKTGNYTISVKNSDNVVALHSGSIYPNEKPVISDFSSRLTASGSADATYEWFLNDSIIPGAVQRSYKAKTAGRYTVRSTGTNGCSRTSEPYILGAVSAEESVPVSAAPAISETGDKLYIRFNTPVEGSLEVFDMIGRKLISFAIEQEKITLDLSGLSKGCYILHINTQTGSYSKQVLRY